MESLLPWKDIAQSILESNEKGSFFAVTSEMSLAECLVKPYKLDQQENISFYQQAIQSSPFLEVVPIDRSVLVEAARIRAKYGLKMPDSIHIATAYLRQCSIILTNDYHLRNIHGITIFSFSDILME